ncbi:hypothetical protein MCEJIRE27_00237 [Candidatus Nanopelagicaceae bacterium]
MWIISYSQYIQSYFLTRRGATDALGDKFPDVSTGNSKDIQITRTSASVLSIESALVLVIALYMIALGFTHDKEWAPYLGVTVFALAGSAGLFALARGVKSGKRWANSPAILANLIALGVAKYQFEAGLYWLAIPIAAMGLTVIVTLFLNIKNSTK